MLHVTMDIEKALVSLEQRMSVLLSWRNATIREAKEIIRKTNLEFDEVAVPLGKEINELRAELEQSASTSRTRIPIERPVLLDGLDDDEQTHYRELLAKRKRK